MTEKLLDELKKITPEEKNILDGKQEIDKQLYVSDLENVYDAKKLLEAGKLISVRSHTRFAYFPPHTHNYVEVIYMCSGESHQVINGNDVFLKEGELLFLSQNAIQEVYPAGENDIAVNFIILPEFFDYVLRMIETEENMLRKFVVDCLCGEKESGGYLHFQVSDVLPVQNLVENLIWSIINKQPNKRGINQVTMGLLFLQLMNHTDKLQTNDIDENQRFIMNVFRYVEEHYKEGELKELAKEFHYNFCWMSKEIKKQTGKTYTELVQERRLNQAVYLLKNTAIPISDISIAVGYENISYFHRIFQKKFGITPRSFRIQNE